MANYAVQNNSATTTLGTAFKTAICVEASSATQALRRGKIYDMLLGVSGSPADNYCTYDISRCTTTPSSGTVGTNNPLDSADSSAAAASIVNTSTTAGDPTITSSSSVFYVSVNQRASYRWVAAPGSELVYPATIATGLCLRALNGGGVGTATATIFFNEQ
jgi:hypothetical protein